MSQISKTKIFNGKKYYLITSAIGIKKSYALLVAEDKREMGYRARAIKIGRKYFVYAR